MYIVLDVLRFLFFIIKTAVTIQMISMKMIDAIKMRFFFMVNSHPFLLIILLNYTDILIPKAITNIKGSTKTNFLKFFSICSTIALTIFSPCLFLPFCIILSNIIDKINNPCTKRPFFAENGHKLWSHIIMG